MTLFARLGDVCGYDKKVGSHSGLPYLGLEHIESGSGQFDLSASNPDAKSQTFRFSSKHVLYGRLRPYLKKVALPETDGRCSTEIFPILPGNSLDRRYLAYWLLSDEATNAINATCTGARMPRADMDAVLDLQIFIPSLKEQHRIVAILCEAFAGIATAKVIAEKSLRNANDVLNDYVRNLFLSDHCGWGEYQISECFKVRSGDFLPVKAMAANGDVDVYGGNGVAGKHNTSNLSGEQIIIGRVGAKCGNVRLVRGPIWLTDNAFAIADRFRDFDNAFLALALEFANLRVTANQAAQPVISYSTIKDVKLRFPTSVEEQAEVARSTAALRVETSHLQSLYTRKLGALDELKQSLLQRAFSGGM